MYVYVYMYIYICWKDIVFHFGGSKLFFSSCWESVVATSAARVDGGILGKHQCRGAMGHCLSSYNVVFGHSSYRRHLKGIKPPQLQNIWWNRRLQIWLQCEKSLWVWAFTVFFVENVAQSWNFVALMTDSICFCRKAKYMSKTFKNK